MSREQILSSGLDDSQVYIRIFDTQLVSLLNRDTNADQIIYNGYQWQPMPTSGDWIDAGGWNEVLAVRGKRDE